MEQNGIVPNPTSENESTKDYFNRVYGSYDEFVDCSANMLSYAIAHNMLTDRTTTCVSDEVVPKMLRQIFEIRRTTGLRNAIRLYMDNLQEIVVWTKFPQFTNPVIDALSGITSGIRADLRQSRQKIDVEDSILLHRFETTPFFPLLARLMVLKALYRIDHPLPTATWNGEALEIVREMKVKHFFLFEDANKEFVKQVGTHLERLALELGASLSKIKNAVKLTL